jgi:hypothetical protein
LKIVASLKAERSENAKVVENGKEEMQHMQGEARQ